MARNRIHMDVPPESVFDVLSDPYSYDDWVVGAKEIRGVEGNWPEPGSRFHHCVGVGPLTVEDHTESLAAKAPNHLVLKAKARPMGTARVEMQLEPEGSGTRVTMIEEAGDPFTRVIGFNPVMDRLVHKRNDEALRRLKDLAEKPGSVKTRG
jgi:uncharacterized protein YndB with AHSA1/START domain